MTRHLMIHDGTAIVRDPDEFRDVVNPETGETSREVVKKGKEHKIKLAKGSSFGGAVIGVPVDVTDWPADKRKALAEKGYTDVKGGKKAEAEQPTGLSPEMAKTAEAMREKALGDVASLPGGSEPGGKE